MYTAFEPAQEGKEIKTDALGSPYALYRMYRAREISQEGKQIETDALGSP